MGLEVVSRRGGLRVGLEVVSRGGGRGGRIGQRLCIVHV